MHIEFVKVEKASQLTELVLSAAEELRGIDFNEEGWSRFIELNTPLEFEKKLTNSDFAIMSCVEANLMLGFISLKEREKVDQLFVIPEARKRGVAALLWQSAKKHAIEKGASGNFWVRSSSVAVPVYQKFGFVLDGERHTFAGIGFQLMKLREAN
jgi:GNAT superfamily N-acetyltransferase